MKIKVLDKHIADKIAAGEVVDRPVSVVKELLENALDAGADNITVQIKEGGKSYIRITDNGSGIAPEDVETAFRRHATSKISTETDLDSIKTLGFRGEALASICAVARVELITKRADERAGRRLVVENSEILINAQIGCPAGTTVTVTDLFYNVPARRKFLSGDGSEARKIIDMVSKVALSYPDVRISLINGEKQVFTTSGKGNILNNIISIYGTDISRDLISVSKSDGDYTIRGFVSKPSSTLSSRSRQIFCINGRVVSSQVLEKAIDKAYRERVFQGRFPIAFLFLVVPPDKLDVNIHPTKREVRFDDNHLIEDFVSDAVRDVINSALAVTTIEAKNREDINQKADTDSFDASAFEKSAASLATGRPDTAKTFPDASKSEQVDIKYVLNTLRSNQEEKAQVEERVQISEIDKVKPMPFDFDDLKIIGSVFNTYIIASFEDNMYLIDQHAAHERVFYEKLKAQLDSDVPAAQQLLIPLNINVAADVAQTEELWIDNIRAMGYGIEFFGNNTYIVRELPAFMELGEGEGFLRDLFNEFSARPDLKSQATMERIIMRSCKSAVKGGDILSTLEIEALLDSLKQCENPYSCPHGRPTFIKMTRYEIERLFKRA